MSQSMGHESLQDYVKRIGEHINLVYKRLGDVEAKLDAISGEVNNLKASLDANKAEVSSLGGSIVLKAEFDEFVARLTDSFKEILPPISEPTEETTPQP